MAPGLSESGVCKDLSLIHSVRQGPLRPVQGWRGAAQRSCRHRAREDIGVDEAQARSPEPALEESGLSRPIGASEHDERGLRTQRGSVPSGTNTRPTNFPHVRVPSGFSRMMPPGRSGSAL